MNILICPECSTLVSDIHQTDIVKTEPQPGDLHLCGNCATLSKYIDAFRLDKLTPHEITQLDPAELSDIRLAVRAILARTNQTMAEEQSRALGLKGKRIYHG